MAYNDPKVINYHLYYSINYLLHLKNHLLIIILLKFLNFHLVNIFLNQFHLFLFNYQNCFFQKKLRSMIKFFSRVLLTQILNLINLNQFMIYYSTILFQLNYLNYYSLSLIFFFMLIIFITLFAFIPFPIIYYLHLLVFFFININYKNICHLSKNNKRSKSLMI